MKIVFAGSPMFAVAPLKNLHGSKDVEIVAVITQPDKPVGRKKVLTATDVKAEAQSLGLPVYDWAKVKEHVAEIKALGADMMITCAYGQLLTQEVLDCFPLGVWNLHASLLPKFRGASPIQSAILAGEKYTGITVMKTELEMDSGGILRVMRLEIGDKTYGDLQTELSILAAYLAVETVERIKKGDCQLLIQDEAQVTFCKKIQKSDCKINFENSAEDICRLVRAMNPEPIAYCNQSGNVLNILKAVPCEGKDGQIGEVLSADKSGIVVRCNGGAVKICELQPAGGKKMSAGDYVNGRKIKAGDRLD
ncbi:MAG: methionyl-tRNA formyltransferase [Clostridia bacterium]|nr:methionyl-tRNA formyltransferase [Clostridia bacterium]